MSSSEFSSLRQIINSSLDVYEAELQKLGLAPPGLLEPVPHPLDDPFFLPNPVLYHTRENLVAALGMMIGVVQQPVRRLWMLGLAHHTSSSLNLITQADIPDILLDAGPGGMPSAEIAGKVNIPEPKLVKVLRLLANQHIFRETKEGYFAHTRTSLPLTRGNPAHHLARDQGWLSLIGAPHLAEVLLHPTKGPSQAPSDSPLGVAANFEEIGATKYFNWLEHFYPKHLDGANLLIDGWTGSGLRGLLADFPWTKFVHGKTIVDVGGGNGALLLPVLKTSPTSRGIIQELHPMAEQARINFQENLPGAVTSGRIMFEERSFFSSQPHKGSAFVYLLRHIIHNWPDEYVVRILGQLAKSMTPDSRLLIIEQISRPAILGSSAIISKKNEVSNGVRPSVPFPLPISLGASGHPECSVDFEMMASFNALDRTEAQYETLVKAAGLQVVKMWTARGPNSVIEVTLPDLTKPERQRL